MNLVDKRTEDLQRELTEADLLAQSRLHRAEQAERELELTRTQHKRDVAELDTALADRNRDMVDLRSEFADECQENAKLRSALLPFARAAEIIDDPAPMVVSDRTKLCRIDETLTVADVRAARAALANRKEKP